MRTLKEENQSLERELLRKDKALAEAAALLVLQIPTRGTRKVPGALGGRGRMTTHEERKQVIVLLNESVTAGARRVKACEILGLSERTLQRWQTGEAVCCDQRPLRDYQPPHKLTAIERAEVLAVANSDEFGHLPPSQIVPRLADQGSYPASESTFYHILREEKQLAHRRVANVRLKREPSRVLSVLQRLTSCTVGTLLICHH
ncbi:MAG: helix-turn-helix domain-containing protein [Candidatus Nitrotoga sp.]|nr:helix-turn-helix domain-containing protein [Candidatus Nitrotoga sp.]